MRSTPKRQRCPRSPEQVIPDSVKRFILTSIPSVPYLEGMLWLRAHPDIDHDAKEVARALYLTEGMAGELLLALEASGVLVQTGNAADATFRYRPHGEKLAARIDALSAAYAANLIEIARLVHDATHRKPSDMVTPSSVSRGVQRSTLAPGSRTRRRNRSTRPASAAGGLREPRAQALSRSRRAGRPR